MTLRMMSALSIHDVRTIEARVNGSDAAPLTLELGTGDWTQGAAEIVLYVESPELSHKLAKAINQVMIAHAFEQEEAHRSAAGWGIAS